MLPALENIPKTPDQWQHWSFDHRDSHDRIRAAIARSQGRTLTDYQIDPIDPNQLSQFLQNNSSLHDDMNSALGLQSTDLQDADLTNENELASWVKLHYQEHFYAEAKSGA
jgi:hypothetical protein